MKHRFGALDAMRGIAALAVVTFHIGQVKLASGLAPHAYLAVDFFFILSGFVVAYTYESSVADGTITVAGYLVRRATRLYPLAILGVLAGAAVMWVKLHVDPTKTDPPIRLAAGTFANLFLLPDPFVGPTLGGMLFPGNGVLWSVCLELVANVVWCVALARAGTSKLVLVVIICFALFATAILRQGTANLGFDWLTLPAGLARTGFGFGLGVIVYRNRSRLVLVRSSAAKAMGIVLLVEILFCPASPLLGEAYDLLAVGILLPTAMILGLNGADHAIMDATLGELSYPLYAIHFPILLVASGLHQKLPALGVAPLLAIVAMVLAAATWLASSAYDRPLRRALVRVSRKERQTASIKRSATKVTAGSPSRAPASSLTR